MKWKIKAKIMMKKNNKREGILFFSNYFKVTSSPDLIIERGSIVRFRDHVLYTFHAPEYGDKNTHCD